MYSPKLEAAIRLASVRHHAQKRKGGGIPYVTHLFHVATLAQLDGGGEDAMIVALLHDVIEDTAKGAQEVALLEAELEHAFGTAITDAIRALSEPKRQSDGGKLPWRERKVAYLKQLAGGGELAWRVSAADKLHNLATLNEDLAKEGAIVWERFTAGPDESLWFYKSAHALLAEKLPESKVVAALAVEVEKLAKSY